MPHNRRPTLVAYHQAGRRWLAARDYRHPHYSQAPLHIEAALHRSGSLVLRRKRFDDAAVGDRYTAALIDNVVEFSLQRL